MKNTFVVYSHNPESNEYTSYGEGLGMKEALQLRDSKPVGFLEIMSQNSWNELGETFVVYHILDSGCLFLIGEMSTSADAKSLIKGPHKYHDYTGCLIMPGSQWKQLKDVEEGPLGRMKLAS